MSRAAFERVRADRDALGQERDALAARVAELEEALERIATRWTSLPSDADEGTPGMVLAAQAEAYEDCASIARAALEALKGHE